MAGTSVRREIVAGVTTFLTMAYIVVVNPAILSTKGTGMPLDGVLTATVLIAFSATLLMGLYAKLPFALAPGMGINAIFTYDLILGRGIPWQVALGIVFISGVFAMAVSVLPIRVWVIEAIPHSLRTGVAAGIGLFLIFIGLKNGGLVASHPVTILTFGGFGPQALLCAAGVVVSVLLLCRKSPFAFIAAIGLVSVAGWAVGEVALPEKFTQAEGVWAKLGTLVSLPSVKEVAFKLDVLGALKLSLLPAILALLFTDLFDSISTFVGVSHMAGLVDEKGNPKNVRQALIVDSYATFGASLFGSSSGTTYVESAAGVEAGGRTGLTAVCTAICFLPCLFIGPVVALIPAYATASVLIVAGILMCRGIVELRSERYEEYLPGILTFVLIPFMFSITKGILIGFIAHTCLYVWQGRWREVKPMMYVLAAVSVALFAIEELC